MIHDHQTVKELAIIVLLFSFLAVGGYFDRVSKFSIVMMSSSIFFAIVAASMRVVAGLGSFAFFSDQAQWSVVIGLVCVIMAMGLSCYDKKLKYDADMAMKKKLSEMVLMASQTKRRNASTSRTISTPSTQSTGEAASEDSIEDMPKSCHNIHYYENVPTTDATMPEVHDDAVRSFHQTEEYNERHSIYTV
jgi:low affinity Fe/Cu permease